MTSTMPPICPLCVHYLKSRNDDVCKAFPDGIPDDITFGNHDHRTPYPGDNGIVFSPKDQDAAEYAEFVFDAPADRQ